MKKSEHQEKRKKCWWKQMDRHCRLAAVLMTLLLVSGAVPEAAFAAGIPEVSGYSMEESTDSAIQSLPEEEESADSMADSMLFEGTAAGSAVEDGAGEEQAEVSVSENTDQDGISSGNESPDQIVPGENAGQDSTDMDFADQGVMQQDDGENAEENGDEAAEDAAGPADGAFEETGEQEAAEESVTDESTPWNVEDPENPEGMGDETTEPDIIEGEAGETEATEENAESAGQEAVETDDRDGQPAIEETDGGTDGRDAAEDAAAGNTSADFSADPSVDSSVDPSVESTPTRVPDPNAQNIPAGEETAENIEEETVSDSAQNAALTASGMVTGSIYWYLYADGKLSVTGTGAIPDYSYDDYEGEGNTPWWNYKDRIVSVEIGSGITSIGEFSFGYCYSLERVKLSDTVRKISQDAFNNCSELYQVDFGQNLDEIGDYAFVGCESLETITLPGKLTSIGACAFSLSGVTNITIPDSVTSLGFASFSDCPNLYYVKIGSGVGVIEWLTFADCPELKNVYLGDSVYQIESEAFLNCPSLKRIEIDFGVYYIGEDAFENTDVVIYCTYDSSAMDYAIENNIKFCVNGYAEVTRATVTGLQSYTYSGSAYKPSPTVKLGITKLVPGQDYTLSYRNNVNAGTATVVITGRGAYGGTQTKSFEINRKPITNASVTAPATKYWEGWGLTPWPTVKLGSITLIKGTDYGLSYSNNKNIGTATITITGKGNYSGTVKKTFRIIPKPTTISKITAGTTRLTIVWKKQASQTSGYQIQYSSRSDFQTQKTIAVAGSGNTSKTISGLAKKHKYYVRVRPYKTVGSTKYFSTWSAAKTATTGGGTSTPAPSAVKLSVVRTIVPIGMKKKLTVSGTSSTVKWSSSAPGVATVSSSGLVVGKKSGAATITAKVSGKTLSCTISVINRYDARQVANMVVKYFRNYYSLTHLVEYRKNGNIVEVSVGRPMGDGAPGTYVYVNIATGKATRDQDIEGFFKKVPHTFVLWNCQ